MTMTPPPNTQDEAPLSFKTLDHPEANGRKATPGDVAYDAAFLIEGGRKLTVSMGQAGFNEHTQLVLEMLANQPSRDDGSTDKLPYAALKAERDALAAQVKKLKPSRIAPVQGYSPGIPWEMHLRAYDAYCRKYGSQQALIEGGCRGGFGDTELDKLIPGWRDELSDRKRVEAERDEARGEVERLREAVKEGVEMAMIARSWVMVWSDKLSPESLNLFEIHEKAFLDAATQQAEPKGRTDSAPK